MIALALLLAAAPVQAAAPVAPTPAPAVAVDSARLAEAGKVLDAFHLERQYDAIFAKLVPVLTVQIFSGLKDNVKIPEKVRAALQDDTRGGEAQRLFATKVMAGFKARYPTLREKTAREYAIAFTLDELNALNAFYLSPIGQKTLTALPELQNKLFGLGATLGRTVGEDAMRATLEEMKLGEERPAT